MPIWNTFHNYKYTCFAEDTAHDIGASVLIHLLKLRENYNYTDIDLVILFLAISLFVFKRT